MIIEFYKDENGHDVIKNFLDSLPNKHKAKAFRSIDLLAEYGNLLQEPYIKHIDGKIWELRIKFASDISRIMYFVYTGNIIILLHGFVKKTEKTPKKEIETAKNRLIDYLSRRI